MWPSSAPRLFSLSGLVVAAYLGSDVVGGIAFGYAVLLYLIIVVVRFLTLLVLFPPSPS